MRKLLVALIGILSGLAVVIFINKKQVPVTGMIERTVFRKEVIGFLPYWLLSSAKPDYKGYLTTLTYFGLTVEADGTIRTMDNPQEAEPGWYALQSGKITPFLEIAKKNRQKTSLLIFSGENDTIAQLITDPGNADRLIDEVMPIMQKYGFTDLNLDLESTHVASDEARINFTRFVKRVREGMDKNRLGTLSIDIAPYVFLQHSLIDYAAVAPLVDHIIVMGYDYHYSGSIVTGAVAQLSGAGITAEYDTAAATGLAKNGVPPAKVILGIPLYGYQWETLSEASRSAIVPGSGLTVSSRKASEFLAGCASCSARFDETSREAYVIYRDADTGTYYQAFFPTDESVKSKITLARKENLGGLALWALGYEDSTILEPLKDY